MVPSSADEMEETEEKQWMKQQLCWNENNRAVSSDGMEREDEGQGPRMVGSGKTEEEEEEIMIPKT